MRTNDALATSVPRAVDARLYHEPDVFAEEQRRIFRGPVWSYVALEAELEGPGAFKSTFVGDTPVVVTRDQEGALHAWVNRCAHKGALVCRAPRGRATDGSFVCVYHQWAYDAQGNQVQKNHPTAGLISGGLLTASSTAGTTLNNANQISSFKATNIKI